MALRPKLKQSGHDRERVMRKKSARKFQRGSFHVGKSDPKHAVSKKESIRLAGEGRSMPARSKKNTYVTKKAGRLLHPGKPKWKK